MRHRQLRDHGQARSAASAGRRPRSRSCCPCDRGRQGEGGRVEIEWREGYANDAADLGERFHKAVSSLVFHQVPLLGKREGIAAMFQAARPGGEVHIADYAFQRNKLMRALFRVTVQLVDGVADTQPNADGIIEMILSDLIVEQTTAKRILWTPTGAISLFQATRTVTTSFA